MTLPYLVFDPNNFRRLIIDKYVVLSIRSTYI
jgi:hypothetical protein